MGLLDSFKKFAFRGNVIDMAVGVVIGGAFGKIISSIVDDIITPALLNPLLNAARLNDLSRLVIPGTAIKYGNFISTCITFIVVAFVLFIVVRMINSARHHHEKNATKAEMTTSERLLQEIRDELRDGKRP